MNNRILSFLVLLTSLFCIGIAHPQNGTLRVIIKDRITSDQCVDCFVNIKDDAQMLRTDSSGICFFENVIVDTVDLVIRSNYESMLLLDVPISKSDTMDVIIELKVICEFDEKSDSVCPKCHKSDKVKPISYGLMFFESKREVRKFRKTYFDAGCNISICHPRWYCNRDDLKY